MILVLFNKIEAAAAMAKSAAPKSLDISQSTSLDLETTDPAPASKPDPMAGMIAEMRRRRSRWRLLAK